MFKNNVYTFKAFPVEERQRQWTDCCCTIIGALFALTLFVVACFSYTSCTSPSPRELLPGQLPGRPHWQDLLPVAVRRALHLLPKPHPADSQPVLRLQLSRQPQTTILLGLAPLSQYLLQLRIAGCGQPAGRVLRAHRRTAEGEVLGE